MISGWVGYRISYPTLQGQTLAVFVECRSMNNDFEMRVFYLQSEGEVLTYFVYTTRGDFLHGTMQQQITCHC